MARRRYGRIVKKRDSLGRSYYLDKETGQRTSRLAWEIDLPRSRHRPPPTRAAATLSPPAAPKGPGKRAPAAHPRTPAQKPFPAGVPKRGGAGGRPSSGRASSEEDYGDEGDYGLDDSFAIDGEEDYEEV